MILLGLSGWLFSAPFLRLAGGFLVKEDGARKADAIVILGGDEFGMRVVKGAELVQAGYAPYAVVSGPPGLLEPESDSTIEFARRKGFPTSLFRPVTLPADSAQSTRSEAIYLSQYLEAKGIHSILLVTSNFHTRRAGALWRRTNPRVSIAVVGAPDKYFTPETWWKSRAGKRTFLYEWLKTLNTWAGM